MHLALENAKKRLADSSQEAEILFRHGSLLVELYKPDGVDNQKPHERDEVYVVATGSGEFINGAQIHTFVSGDVIFVKAGVDHRFVNFTDDFSTWVFFYGPVGGESDGSSY